MTILDGKLVAAQHRKDLEAKLAALKEIGVRPQLAIVLAGDDKASAMYANSMKKVAAKVGLDAEIYSRPETVTEEEMLSLIGQLNDDPAVYGILMMIPLPKHLNTRRIANTIRPDKDVDGQTDANIAYLFSGQPCLVPCTPKAAMAILDYYGIDLAGKEVVIIGRSNVVGKPLFQLCLNRNATVTVCHSRTRDLPAVARRADILISATGKANLVTADMVKPGAIVIDVGINYVDGKTVGDVDYEPVAAVASAITPVPGGVGSVTTTMVLENVISGQGVGKD